MSPKPTGKHKSKVTRIKIVLDTFVRATNDVKVEEAIAEDREPGFYDFVGEVFYDDTGDLYHELTEKHGSTYIVCEYVMRKLTRDFDTITLKSGQSELRYTINKTNRLSVPSS